MHRISDLLPKEYLKEAKTSIHHKDDSDGGKKKRYRPLNYF